MPSKTSKKKRVTALPKIPKELINQIVSGPMDAEAVNAASMAFKKSLIERILGGRTQPSPGLPPAKRKGRKRCRNINKGSIKKRTSLLTITAYEG